MEVFWRKQKKIEKVLRLTISMLEILDVNESQEVS